MKRSLRYLLATAPLLASTLAQARDLPNINVYHAAKPVNAVKPGWSSAAPAAISPPAAASSFDALRGVPTFLWAARAPGGSPFGALSISPEGAARGHLQQHAARYGLSSAALSTAFVTQVHDTGRGGIIVVLRQRPGGVEVFHNDVKVLMDRSLALVAVGGNLHAAAVPKPKAAAFKLSQPEALAAAFKDLYGIALTAGGVVDLKKEKGGYHYFTLGAVPAVTAPNIRFLEPARAKPVWFPMPDRLVPAYFVELLSQRGTESRDAYSYVIAADDGRLLYRENQTHYAAYSYRVFADTNGDHRPMDGPTVDFTPHPTGTPDGSFPAFATPNLITIDGFNKFGDPWLPGGATASTGNNVDAYTDDGGGDGFSGPPDLRAAPSGPSAFDYTYDTSQDAKASNNQKMAAVTNLFYITNWLHDWWYDSGFDEAAGNAQQSNLGRGGIEGDVLLAEAQDFSGKNNSNMSAMSDGMSPRMQMFLWDGMNGSSSLNVTPPNLNPNTAGAEFGQQSFSNVIGDVVLAVDGTAPVNDACQAITNSVSGKIALVDRNMCTFESKALRAQQAGAIGLIIANNGPGLPPNPMADDAATSGVTIPVLGVSQNTGNTIKTSLMNGPVTATMSRTASVDYDGSLDVGVAAHEWGHYLHLRQVFGGNAQISAMSEGWSDFNALLTVVRQGDNLDGTYALASYATASLPDDPAYFGIRRYPYSTDMTKSPLTFKNITTGVAEPPGVPEAASLAGSDNAEPHNAGEIWSAWMFEAYIAMAKQSQGPNPPYTFDQARRRISDYVVAGMKVTPTDPTYTEQRDGILAAAAAADLADLAVIAGAFAKRGAGTCAVSPARDSTNFSGVVESFTIQANVAVVSATLDDNVKSCDKDGNLDAGEIGDLTVTVMNTGTAPLMAASVTASSNSADVSFPNGPKVNFGTVAPFATGTATIQVALAGSVGKKENVDLTVTVNNTGSCAATKALSTSPLVNFDELPMTSKSDSVEEADTVWARTGTDAAEIWTRTEPTLGNHVWTGVDFGSPSDTALVSPGLAVSATDPFVLTFRHRHDFEQSMGVNWDGSVIEVSTDNGTSWKDVSTLSNPGYGGVIGDPMNQAQNVLKDRQGYIGQNPAYPMLESVTIDMGQKLAGQKVLVRFRIGTDDAAGANGWDIDDITFSGITNTPFPSLVDDMTPCQAPATTGSTTSSGVTTTTGGTTTGGTGGAGGDGGNGGSGGGGIEFGGCGCFVAGDASLPLGAPLGAPLLAILMLLRRRRQS